MFEMPTEATEIADSVIRLVRGAGRIRGASLGAAIRQTFPDVDLRQQYGGLRRFIEAHCAEHVVVVDKQGLDDVYAARDAAGLAEIEQEPPMAFRQEPREHATAVP